MKYLIAVFLFFVLSSKSFAYRGQGYIEQEPPPQTPLSDFPGFFDTNMAPRKKLVMEIPTFSMDYGHRKCGEKPLIYQWG